MNKDSIKKTKPCVFQIKVTLEGISLPIWRRLLVKSDMKLEKLHMAIQKAMGWGNCHLHAYEIEGERYISSDPGTDFDDLYEVDEATVTIGDVISGPGMTFTYTYDFGDSWDHEILVEKQFPLEKNLKYPVCLAGKGACPPEDCGGTWGYKSMLEVLKNPKDPEYREMKEWIGGKFDPSAFDVDAVNRLLRKRGW